MKCACFALQFLKFTIRGGAQLILSSPGLSEKNALKIQTIAPLFSSDNRPDAYMRLCIRLPYGSLRNASQKLRDIERGSSREHDLRLRPPLRCRLLRSL